VVLTNGEEKMLGVYHPLSQFSITLPTAVVVYKHTTYCTFFNVNELHNTPP